VAVGAAAASAEAAPRGGASTLALVLSDRELWLIYGNIVVYAVCFNLQAPVMPALTASFGSSSLEYGTLMSLFALVQLVGGLLCGPLMDVNGPRWGFMVSFLSGALAYGMTAFANSMPLLYLSRLPMAAQHAALAARIAVSAKATTPGGQAALLGYISLAYSVGAVIGPVLGGALASHSLRIVSLVAAALSVLSAATIALGMPASCSTNRRMAQQPQPSSPVAEHGAPPPPPPPPVAKHSKLSLADFKRVATLQGVPSLLATKGVLSLVLALFHGVFALAASTHFGLSPAATGAVLSGMSVMTMVTQAVVIDWAVARFPPRSVFAVNATAMAASLVGLAASTRMATVMVFLVPLSVSSCILSTLNTAQLNAAAAVGDRGSMNAIDMSVSSGVRVFSPALGTWMLFHSGECHRAPGILPPRTDLFPACASSPQASVASAPRGRSSWSACCSRSRRARGRRLGGERGASLTDTIVSSTNRSTRQRQAWRTLCSVVRQHSREQWRQA
jgi:OCT family organic cation transporter-like MFS transporter 18